MPKADPPHQGSHRSSVHAFAEMVALSRYASTVTLVVRGTSLAASMSEYLIRELRVAANITIRYSSEVVAAIGDQHLERIAVRDTNTGAHEVLETAGLFVLIGSETRTEWLPETVKRDEWGFILTAATRVSTLSPPRRRAYAASLQPVTFAEDPSNASPPR